MKIKQYITSITYTDSYLIAGSYARTYNLAGRKTIRRRRGDAAAV